MAQQYILNVVFDKLQVELYWKWACHVIQLICCSYIYFFFMEKAKVAWNENLLEPPLLPSSCILIFYNSEDLLWSECHQHVCWFCTGFTQARGIFMPATQCLTKVVTYSKLRFYLHRAADSDILLYSSLYNTPGFSKGGSTYAGCPCKALWS